MIDIKDKSCCCGCSACVQRCPKQCIAMVEDHEGFLYPVIDRISCIDCGLCEKVCPVLNRDDERRPLNVYAAKNKDESIRYNSSSGGIFTQLASAIIDKGGVVFGASFNEYWEVAHSYTETREGIAVFRGSKYVQSIVGDTFKQVEAFLKQGREVLFSGTPCQIAGLKHYLRKDYDNLITIDFICHGVPSPGVLRWYIAEEIAKKNGQKNFFFESIQQVPKPSAIAQLAGYDIEGISFRDKRRGWKKFSFTLTLSKKGANHQKKYISHLLDRDCYLRGFFKDLYLRPSCNECPAKAGKSGSDITLADFWGYMLIDRNYDDDKGISAVVINSKKGYRIFHSIDVDKREAPYEFLCSDNPSINNSAKYNKDRELFYNCTEPSFNKRLIALCGNNWKEMIKNDIAHILKKMGIRK